MAASLSASMLISFSNIFSFFSALTSLFFKSTKKRKTAKIRSVWNGMTFPKVSTQNPATLNGCKMMWNHSGWKSRSKCRWHGKVNKKRLSIS